LGRTKAPAIAINVDARPAAKPAKPSTALPKGRLDPALQHAAHLAKPQLTFGVKPDNFTEEAWRPTLRHKYHAQVPLGYMFEEPGAEVDLLLL
jgi:exosome complex exonuclease RRP6